jgi:predicted MFS family arabinose efflux permease
MQVGANFARTAAPFIAGALLSWEAVGPAGTFFFMACVMAVVILTYFHIPPTSVRANRNETSLLQDVRRGLNHVRRSPQLLQSIISFQLVAILGFSYIVLIPGFAKDVMDAGNAGVGILLGAAAAGGVVTSLVAAGAADSRHARTLLHGSSLLLGLALIGFGLAPSFPVAVVMMVGIGGGSSAFQTLNNVSALRHAHRDFYGRVMGFMFIAWGLTNLAGLPVGALADAVGERSVLVGLGALLCVATAGFVLWARTAPEEPRPAPHVIVLDS